MTDNVLEHLKVMGFMVQNGNISMQERARHLVYRYVKARLDKTDTHVTFSPEEVFVVWFCKTLQNWKCLISTTLPDGMYYEITYDGDQECTYLDAYKKFDNVALSLEGEAAALISDV